MAEFPALPLWTDAYLGDTRHLSTLEHGAYLLLLMTAWRSSETSLPDDDKLLARYCGLGPRQWAAVRPVLEEFHDIKNGRWFQLRLVDEKQAVQARKETAAANGRASALKRKGRHSTKRPTEREQSDTLSDSKASTTTPTPIPIPKPSDNIANAISSSDAEKKKASRLPEMWVPQRAYPEPVAALLAQWPEGREARELDQFRDYWRTLPRNATKLDWDATWHNRIRDQHDRIMRENRHAANGRNAPANPRGNRPDPGLTLYLDAVAEIREAGNSEDDWGDGDPIPAKYLR